MVIKDAAAMQELGTQFAQKIQAPTVIELLGDVGAGKTTFVQGLAKGLGVEDVVTSPSFTISKEYQGKNCRLIHYDFYRLNNPGLMMSDLLEKIHDPHNIVVIEWGKSVADVLPKKHPKLAFQCLDDGTRLVEERP